MDPKDRELLERTFQYSRENNKILRKMRRSMRVASFLRVVYWIIIIGAAILLYYYLEPTINALFNFYESLGGLENFQNLIESGAALNQ